MDKNKLQVGKTILIEQAWEDETGNYHDEHAEVIAINDDGTLELNFIGVKPEVEKFLKGCTFEVKDYQ